MAERVTVLVSSATKEEVADPTFALKAPVRQLADLELDTQRITDEVSKLLRCIEKVETPQDSHFEVSEVQFNLAVSAKGKLAILCASGEAGVEAAIKVTIKRCSQDAPRK